MIRSFILFISLLVTFAMSSQAFSENGGFSVYLGVGKADSTTSASDLSSDFTNGCENGSFSCNINDSDTTYFVGLNYKLNDQFNIDLRYEDLGEVVEFNSLLLFNEHMLQETKILSLSIQARYQTNTNFSPFAELGFGLYESDVNYTSPILNLSNSVNGETMVYGLGIAFKASQFWGLRLGWRRYEEIGKRDGIFSISPVEVKTLDTEVDTVYLSAEYIFNSW